MRGHVSIYKRSISLLLAIIMAMVMPVPYDNILKVDAQSMNVSESVSVSGNAGVAENTTVSDNVTVSENIVIPDENIIVPDDSITVPDKNITVSENVSVPEEEALLTGVKPTVIVKEAYDKYLSIVLGAPENFLESEETLYYYVVDITIHKSDRESAITERFYFKKSPVSSQEEVIELNCGLIEDGQEWTYDITAFIIQVTDDTEFTGEALESMCVGMSGAEVVNNVPVIPYYESKITLSSVKTTIYTTQQNIAVAKIKFGKNTTEKGNIKVEDTTYSGDGALAFSMIDENYNVYVSAGNNTALGKHVMKVTADAPQYAQGASATITVNVVQGIEEGMLSMTVPADKLYKAENKAASLTFKIQYNKDSFTDKLPSRKKVTWEVLSPDFTPFDADDNLYGKISIKNGVVTVKKDFAVSDIASENTFVVKAAAADFTGNTVSIYSGQIEIVPEVEAFGEVVILQTDNAGNGYVSARSNTNITADKLGYVRVLKADAPMQDMYTAEELSRWSFEPRYLTYQSSNKVMTIDKDGKVTVSKPAKNLKITVKANDKSNRRAVLNKLTVTYDFPVEIALKIDLVNSDDSLTSVGEISSSNTEYFVPTKADSCYKLTVVKRNGEADSWSEIDSYVDFAISVKSGNVIKTEGTYKQTRIVRTTKEKFTISLTDKSSKKKVIYTITNSNYPKGKNPKLATKDKLKALSYESEQNVTYSIKKNGSFTYDYAGKYVLVTLDTAEKYKNDKQQERYNAFERVVTGLGYQSVNEGTVNFNFATRSDKPLPAGTYKLWFTFGTIDGSGQFVPDTKAVAVSLKAQTVKIQKGSYTPNTTYSMSVKEGGKVNLSGKGKNYIADTITYTNVKNAIVKGNANGFRTYFELNGNMICLKNNLTEEQVDYIMSSAAKDDWTGYVDYTVMLANTDGTYSKKSGTFKVAITMKNTVRKFTIPSMNASDTNKTVKASVYANGKRTEIIHAASTGGSYQVTCDGTSALTFTPKTGSAKPKGGENKVTVYVVPLGTYESYRLKLDELKQAWDNASYDEQEDAYSLYVTALKKYGIKITATVVLPTRMVENREECEQVVALVNKERAKAGLAPVSIADDVMYASYIRARETSKYFAHERPDGRSCFTVLGECGIGYTWAGENIAYGWPSLSAEEVMDGWMNSPGHRANILSPNFREIGVGCYKCEGGTFWVQLFISR